MAPRKITTRRTSLPTERTKHSEKPKIIPRRSISTEEFEKVPQQENRFVIIKTMKNQNVEFVYRIGMTHWYKNGIMYGFYDLLEKKRSCGEMCFQPGAFKPKSKTKDTIKFFVRNGHVSLHFGKLHVELRPGDCLTLERGTAYEVKNIGKSEAVLYFFHI